MSPSARKPGDIHHTVTIDVTGNTYTIEFGIPDGVEFDEIALYTDVGTLIIGSDTQVFGAITGFGTLVNVSNLQTSITGATTEVGNVWATGNIQVTNGARVHGFARTPGTVTINTGAVVDQSQPGTTLTEGETFTQVVTFPITNLGDRTALLGTLLVLDPGNYADLAIEANASLELRSGTYLVDSLGMHATGRLRVRASSGPVELFVRNALDFAGALDVVAGSASQFRLVYLGTADVTLRAPFFATVFAPRARLVLAPGASDADELVGTFFAGSLETLPGVIVRQQAFFTASTPIVARYFYGFSGEVGAGPYERALSVPEDESMVVSGGGALPALTTLDDPPDPLFALTIGDSRTYSLAITTGATDAARIQTMVLQASELTRPFVTIDGDDTDAANLQPASRDASSLSPPPRRFELDGVWLGTDEDSGTVLTRDFVIEPANPPTEDGFDWDEIVIRHATIDPGGLRADQTRIAALVLNVVGRVRRLVIERSIVGPIEVTGDGFVEEIAIKDSIVDATQRELDAGRRVAIRSANGVVRLTGVTVFGDVRADILEATDTVVTGQLIVADTQASCFRFGAASAGPPEQQRLPRLFHSEIVEGGVEPFFFTSQRFGDPGYAQVSRLAPLFVREGAENGSELGAFSFLRTPIRLASILAKVDEFKPIGVLAQFILEGEAAT